MLVNTHMHMISNLEKSYVLEGFPLFVKSQLLPEMWCGPKKEPEASDKAGYLLITNNDVSHHTHHLNHKLKFAGAFSS